MSRVSLQSSPLPSFPKRTYASPSAGTTGHSLRPSSESELSMHVIPIAPRLHQLDSSQLKTRIQDLDHQLRLRHPDDLNRSYLLAALGLALVTLYSRQGGMMDIDKAVTLLREALQVCEIDSPYRSSSVSDLALALWTRSQHTGQMVDLEESITLHREAFLLRPIGHPYRTSSLTNLASAIRTRYDRKGVMSDLDEAIILQREGLLLQPIGHPDRSKNLNNLANAVWTRFRHKGEMVSLEEAISLNREALRLQPVGHPDRPTSFNSLAITVLTLFQQKGGMANLEEAITLNREGLLLRPVSDLRRSSSLDNLAIAVRTRFNHKGEMEDLDEAIKLHREGLLSRPTGHPHRPNGLTSLANAVQTRYEQKGEILDLDEAIMLHREALLLRPVGHPDRPKSLNNLATIVWTRFRHKGESADLEEAIALHQAALLLRPISDPGRTVSLNNLARTLRTRFEEEGKIVDLDEAINLHRQALLLRPNGHPDRSRSLNDLANALQSRFEHSRDMGDLDEAIALHREALLLRPIGHPERSTSLTALGTALLTLVGLQTHDSREGFKGDVITPIALFREGANTPATPVVHRLRAAYQWARLSRSSSSELALGAYITTLALLDKAVAQSRSLETRHTYLSTDSILPRSDLAGLTTDASSCAVDQGRLELAVELLEQGRATILTQIGRYRTQLDAVLAVDADLANEFQRLSWQLDASLVKGENIKVTSNSLQDSVARYQTTVTQWNKVVERIRALDGLQSFLRPTPFVELQRVAMCGPVIIININKNRSDAIVLSGEGSPCLVPLPAATPSVVHKLSEELAIQANQSDNKRAVVSILRKIWDIIVGPVVEELQATVPPGGGSRIWWCPTSSATRLPLHAAGQYRTGARNLPDMYVSSYTPTLGALIRARQLPVGYTSPARPSMLAIAQPVTPGENPLPAVVGEMSSIRAHVPHATFLEGSHATRRTVLSGLAQHSWVHLACHGHQLPKPFESHFSLHDERMRDGQLHNGRLRIVDIVERGLHHAELAVLSACHSAAGDKATPDEGLHLTAAMQFAGFRSVVGTMWAMVDEDGPMLMDAFYKEMLGGEGTVPDCTNAAAALSKAVKVLRKNKVPESRWINFVHYGA